MLLDYNPAQQTFFVRVSRHTDTVTPVELMREHGLDFSNTASSEDEAVLLTKDPFAAVTFFEYGTSRAKEALAALQHEIAESWRATSDRHIPVPYGKELWPFQKANIEYALRRQHTLVGDQPGLGKTPTAIGFCNELQAENVLVICPASIRMQWAKRIQEWSTMRRKAPPYIISKSTNGVHNTNPWTIVSYDLARREPIGRALAQRKYDVLILDEPHYLKESTSLRTRAIFTGLHSVPPLAEHASRIMGLTGTPLPNRPREAYTLARGLCWESIDWASEEKFKVRYNPSMLREVTTVEGTVKKFRDERTGRHSELQNRLRGNFMTRHLKHGPQGVMNQLQMPIYDLIQVEETGPVKQALEAESLLDLDPDFLFLDDDYKIDGHISVVRRLMGIALAPQVADYAEMLYEGGEEKVVIFAWHTEVLDILEERLREYGVVRIDGRTTMRQKQARVDKFVVDHDVHFAIGNILSMGVGTDGFQQVCNHGLIAEPDWVPGNNIQCFDRLDRGGQGRQVQGDIFVAPGSIAEKVLASALRKNQVIHQTLDYQFGG